MDFYPHENPHISHTNENVHDANSIHTRKLKINLMYAPITEFRPKIFNIGNAAISFELKIPGYDDIYGGGVLDSQGILSKSVKLTERNTNTKQSFSFFSGPKITGAITLFLSGEHVTISEGIKESVKPGDPSDRDDYLTNRFDDVKYVIPINIAYDDNDNEIPIKYTFNGVQEKFSKISNKYIFGYVILNYVSIYITKLGYDRVGIVHAIVQKDNPSGTYSNNYRQSIILLDNDNVWLPSTILHEYGHHVMFSAGFYGMKSAGGDHFFCDPAQKNQDLMWTEGYATGFSLVMMDELELKHKDLGTSMNPYLNWRDGKEHWHQNLEYYYCDIADVELDEGRIAALIYDLYDGRKDSVDDTLVPKIMKDKKLRGKTTIQKEYFGDSNYKDDNEGSKITPYQLLIASMMDGYTGLFPYLTSILNSVKENQVHLQKTCRTFLYNKMPMWMLISCQSIPIPNN
ncbi:hypothetical protein DLAC_06418 [Tieghemostelium lacteum]|uniref:Uncharacterized protein n=1 Tax=Tieghemostelium lacteum TaxID=361077 RepID=A0A151ZEQ5_TIELA|nr:hypothetical protein DLAC_06418 [Tieghemostelium lacteum]|eukprot:KYQ92438.1 hypothetical protein DLAC_06418 [Tieghemostelium lacteum]